VSRARSRRRWRVASGAIGSAREVVLGRIRAAKGPASSAEVVRAEWDGVRRGYQRSARHGQAEVIELLIDRLHDYDAQVMQVGRDEVSGAVAKMMKARGVRRLVAPAGLRADAMVDGFEFVVDEGMSAAELNGVDGVVTESTVAIGETGTIVLQNSQGQGRRAVSLVPDYHLCIVRAEDIVETVPEAMDRLAATSSLATTFISGPSATADIEMTRIKGVHGPRFLDVILVE
jgi:L-lactate dehydrogenase complex protein LldG